MNAFSIKIKNYKCFKDETGFDDIKRVNLIIGRNNTGKSSLLDLIEAVTKGIYTFDRSTWSDSHEPQIIYETEISKPLVDRIFNGSGGRIHMNHRQYGQQYIGRKIRWSKNGVDENNTNFIFCDDEGILPPLKSTGGYEKRLPANIPIPIYKNSFKRVVAERDIVPELHDENIQIAPNGVGITNAIQCIINRTNRPSDLIENNFLTALNKIFIPDSEFTDIVCQLKDGGTWEIYLEEDKKGRIALSKSGSGLKTVITVLANLILIPYLEQKNLKSYIFGFEELENNIHPALLRRLNNYIYRSSIKNDFTYFLTTHSNVLIDQFSKQEDAQIIHVTHNNSHSETYTAKTYIQNNGILDDLDVRASDLLQSNGIIWVEGPSDRIYLNRWISLWSDHKLKEGTHYQILFYGGRLLSHLSAEFPETVDKSIALLNANRNAIIMIDSDKRANQTPLNNTKKRIIEEFEKLGSLCWITNGKEVENYIPKEVVSEYWNLSKPPQVEKYESFFEYIDRLKKGEGKKYSSKKPMLAEKLIPIMEIENLKPVLDLAEKMDAVVDRISSWNK